MEHYHLIKSVLGGSDVYDDQGNQVGYSLPSVLGDGEDFFDMQGNPVGQSFDDGCGGFFTGPRGGGLMDPEILMGQNLYADGDLFGKQEDAFGPDSFDAGTDE